MLLRDQVPFLLTILFVALGWTTNHLWESISKSATIESHYINETEDKNIKKYKITNISSEHMFEQLFFKLRISSQNAGCVSAEINPVPPVELRNYNEFNTSNEIQQYEEPECFKDYAKYKVYYLQPNAEIILSIRTEKPTDITLHIWSKNRVRVIENTLETFLIKNRFNVLVYLFLAWSTLILVYLIIIFKQKTKL